MNLVTELYAITAALTAAGIRDAVCGGVAVTLYGATRSTEDIDLRILPADVQRTLDVARPLGYVFASFPMTFDAGTERERHMQRVSKIVGSRLGDPPEAQSTRVRRRRSAAWWRAGEPRPARRAR